VRILLLFLLWWSTSTLLSAQETAHMQKITENGKTYILYRVQQGETLYSIAKRFNVEIQKLTEINPGLTNGLRSGEVIKISDNQSVQTVNKGKQEVKPSRFFSYKVQRKETLYSISRKYGVSIENILTYNPGVTELKKGVTIQIPQWDGSKEKNEPEDKQLESGRAKVTYHVVSEGETFYSISRKYDLTTLSLMESNPDVTVIKPGMRLIIPVPLPDPGPSDPEAKNFSYHKIQKGETLYSISRKYGVSADVLVELNPSLEKSCKVGNDIRIPKSAKAGDTPSVTENDRNAGLTERKTASEERTISLRSGDCLPDPPASREKQTIKVVMLLPLMISDNMAANEELIESSKEPAIRSVDNQSDTLRAGSKAINSLQFQGNSENFLHFYEGALLAIDSLQQMGIKVDLEVWDTEQKASKVKNFISSGVLNNADLIVGPVYPNEQKEIGDFAVKRKIPVISPLSPSDEQTKENEYFFQVNPSREYTSDKTNEYIVSAFKGANFVVLQTSNSGNEAETEVSRLKQQMEISNGKGNAATIRLCNFRKDGYASLHEKMEKDKKNILVLSTNNEAEVSVVVSNMKNLSAEFDVTVIGNSRFPQFESIDPEHYHLGNLEFLTPYWPDPNIEVTRSFIRNFRAYYRTDPNQYSIQGYDVTFFFVKALSDFGSDFRKCIYNEKAGLVQGTYHFAKYPTGGYVNKGLSVIQYQPSFEIVRKKIFTE
jgi:LysM repeat protein/ABC-type branched-subunit amino acid transport system substrate-binding protein